MKEGINGSHKVVIVDKDKDYLESTRIALSAPGCTVIECLDAQSAISTIMEETAEHLLLVITDLTMENPYDGIPVALQAKSKSATRVIIQSESENNPPPSGIEFRYGKLRPTQLDQIVQSAMRSAASTRAQAEPPMVR